MARFTVGDRVARRNGQPGEGTVTHVHLEDERLVADVQTVTVHWDEPWDVCPEGLGPRHLAWEAVGTLRRATAGS